VANGPWMARRALLAAATSKALAGTRVLARASIVERVTGIEPALSAWESCAARPSRQRLGWRAAPSNIRRSA
jgi:hypothetical protein